MLPIRRLGDRVAPLEVVYIPPPPPAVRGIRPTVPLREALVRKVLGREVRRLPPRAPPVPAPGRMPVMSPLSFKESLSRGAIDRELRKLRPKVAIPPPPPAVRGIRSTVPLREALVRKVLGREVRRLPPRAPPVPAPGRMPVMSPLSFKEALSRGAIDRELRKLGPKVAIPPPRRQRPPGKLPLEPPPKKIPPVLLASSHEWIHPDVVREWVENRNMGPGGDPEVRQKIIGEFEKHSVYPRFWGKKSRTDKKLMESNNKEPYERLFGRYIAAYYTYAFNDIPRPKLSKQQKEEVKAWLKKYGEQARVRQ